MSWGWFSTWSPWISAPSRGSAGSTDAGSTAAADKRMEIEIRARNTAMCSRLGSGGLDCVEPLSVAESIPIPGDAQKTHHDSREQAEEVCYRRDSGFRRPRRSGVSAGDRGCELLAPRAGKGDRLQGARLPERFHELRVKRVAALVGDDVAE